MTAREFKAQFPAAALWREYQIATATLNARKDDDPDLETEFHEAQNRFIYAEDATQQGI